MVIFMAMTDEVKAAQHFKPKVKEKKSFAEAFIPMKGDAPKTLVGKLVTILSVLVIIVCGAVVGREFYFRYEADRNSDDFWELYGAGSIIADAGGAEEQHKDPAGADTVIREPLVLLSGAVDMLDINSDYAGYVRIPDCFKEPVVQAEDNEKYLNLNFYGQKRSAGTVFADYRNVVNDYDMSDNIILYGHNNRDGTMFGNLDYYLHNKRYWEKNPFIYFDTKYETGVYVIIASFVTNTEPEHDNGNVFDYQNFISFSESGDYSFDSFMSHISVRTQINTGIDINKDDKFLTLSTCQYYWEPCRHIIVARKLRPGEAPQNIDTTNFEINQNAQWPAIYYRYGGN